MATETYIKVQSLIDQLPNIFMHVIQNI